jgi:RHS repeat-associated protein
VPSPASSGDDGSVAGCWYNDNVNTSLSNAGAFSYDSLNRLTQATATPVGSGTVSYNLPFSYDRYGNMTCTLNGNTNGPCPQMTYSSSNNNQLAAVGGTGVSYDAAGDMTYGGTHTHLYDAEERLVSVDGGNARSQVYNALGEEVELKTPSYQWEHLFDPRGRWIQRVGSYGNSGMFYLGSRLLAFYGPWPSPNTFFIHESALGSENGVTDAAGTDYGETIFYPWGDSWASAGTVEEWHFAGFQWADPTPTLYPTPFRQYTPDLGRRMTQDPLGGEVTNPQSLNRYAYVTNNPTTFTDPLRLSEGLGCDPFDPGSCGPPPCNQWTDIECNPGCSIGDPDCTPGCGALGYSFPCGPIGPPPVHIPGGGGGGSSSGGSASSAPPRSGTGSGNALFGPGAINPALPCGGLFEVLVEACGLNPVACAAVVGGATLAGIGYEGYQLYRHLHPSPAAGRPRARAPAPRPFSVHRLCFRHIPWLIAK